MSELLTSAQSNGVVWLLLSVVAVASLVYAIVTWRKSNEKKQLEYASRCVQLIKAGSYTIADLSLSYGGLPINDLHSTKVVIWNSSSLLIRPDDLVQSEPLGIMAQGKGSRILEAQLLAVSDSAENVRIATCSDEAVQIDFDFLEQGDGLCLQLLHTGEDGRLGITGRIMGGKPLKAYVRPITNAVSTHGRRISVVADVFASLAMLTVLANAVTAVLRFYEVLPKTESLTVSTGGNSALMIGYLTFVVVGVVVFSVLEVISIRRRLHSGIPKSLRKCFVSVDNLTRISE